MSGPARGRVHGVPRANVAPATVALPQPRLPRALEALLGLPDSRVLDRLLRGRAWIALIALALIGLVFMQVSMLGMNAGIGQAVEKTGTLERQNADLRAQVSQLSSEERIQREAAASGLIMPPAGDVRYLRSNGTAKDAARAAQIMRAPSEQAKATAAAAAAGAVAITADQATAGAATGAPTPAGETAAAGAVTTAPAPPAASPAAPQAQAQQAPAQTQTQTQSQAPAPAPAAPPAQQAPAQAPQQAPATAAGAAVAPTGGQ